MDFLKNIKIKRLLITIIVSSCVFLSNITYANATDVVDWDTIGAGSWTGIVMPANINEIENFYLYGAVQAGMDGWLSSVQLRLRQNQNACGNDKLFRVVIRNYVSDTDYGSIIGWSDYYQCNELPDYDDNPLPLSDFELEGLNRISLYFDDEERFWLGIEFLDGEEGTGNTLIFGLLHTLGFEQLFCDNEDCDNSTYADSTYALEMRTWVDIDTPEPITPSLPDVVACLPHNYIPPEREGDIGDLNAIAENLYQFLADTPIIGDALFINCVIYLNFYSELETITTSNIPFHINVFDTDETVQIPLQEVKIALETWVSDIEGYEDFRIVFTTFLWVIIAFGLYFALLHPLKGGGNDDD